MNACLYNEHMYEIKKELSLNEKLEILSDAAKYDVACTSSGVDRRGQKGLLGNARSCGICHTFAADGRCVSLLKILMTNHCAYDCRYCINRVSNDVPRATFTPQEICELTIEFYKRNYIEGLFLSSGVLKNPTYTMERMCETLLLLRTKYRFNGYIHVKTIPGASDELISAAGYLADRISVNLELPTEETLRRLAPNKSFKTIIGPMEKISGTIASNRLESGRDFRLERSSGNRYLKHSIFNEPDMKYGSLENSSNLGNSGSLADNSSLKTFNSYGSDHAHETYGGLNGYKSFAPAVYRENSLNRTFAPAGQSTQMIIGATEESDYNIIRTTQTLYQRYDLKRVFYSAYVPLNEDAALPPLDTAPPLLREHRLYQADWLLRFYGFHADELLSEQRPDFNEKLDPKCDWAVRHLGEFPVEVETASYEMLLRVPGIGPKSASRIIKARKYGRLDYNNLKKMGVVLKRAHYFITCNGRMMYKIPIEEQYITRQLELSYGKENWQISHQNEQFHQMTLEEFGVK